MTATATATLGPDAAAAEEWQAVYLSPHLDDVALSCGGQVHRRCAAGGQVLVLTLFAGPGTAPAPPLAKQLHRHWGLPEDPAAAIEVRRREDLEALDELGAYPLRCDLPDALYRRHGDGQAACYPTLRSLFATPVDEEAVAPALDRLLHQHLHRLPSAARIVAPLAVGGHVDHQLLRQAAERLLGDDPRLRYYEEYPYAQRVFAVRRALGKRRFWIPEVEPLGDSDLDAKCRAVARYRSQLASAFADETDMRTQLTRFARRRGGERLWRRRRSA